MQLIVDVGNSYIKIFVFDDATITVSYRYTHTDFFDALPHFFSTHSISCAIVSNVSGIQNVYQTIRTYVPTLEFSHRTPIPLANNYATPHTLGLDRIAAAVGAETVQPHCHKLIIDAGTAITIDYVSDCAAFEGGNISPGIEARFRALHDYTGKLPKLNLTEKISLIGKTTEEAIQNGVIQGVLYEIQTYIQIYAEKFPSISVFFTGGNADFLEKTIQIFDANIRKHTSTALIAQGLQRILAYNQDSIAHNCLYVF
ncbi:MAG: type III pantothenate kinase [Bacteroidales bacterium]|jgi:type III pantothenate kinase|nr:type III pantothenate kinase [Bacteroidales bacterium]